MFAAPSGYVWHYTVGSHLPPIAQSGGLQPAQAQVMPPPRTGRAILWFSRQQQWEPAVPRPQVRVRATHGGRDIRLEPGLFRLGLPQGDVRLLPWPGVTRIAELDVAETMSMVESGLRQGANPTDWLGTLAAIPLEDLRFQAWDGHTWVDADLHAFELAHRHAGRTERATPRATQPARMLATHDAF